MPVPPKYSELDIYFQYPIPGCEARCQKSPKESGRIGDHWKHKHTELGPWNGRNTLVKTRNEDGTCEYIASIYFRSLSSRRHVDNFRQSRQPHSMPTQPRTTSSTRRKTSPVHLDTEHSRARTLPSRLHPRTSLQHHLARSSAPPTQPPTSAA
jgi:hypothetical protein